MQSRCSILKLDIAHDKIGHTEAIMLTMCQHSILLKKEKIIQTSGCFTPQYIDTLLGVMEGEDIFRTRVERISFTEP